MEDNSAFVYKKKPSASTLMLRLLCSHLGMFLVVSIYAAVGALIFIEIEIGDEEKRFAEKRVKALQVNQSVNYLANVFWFYRGKENITYAEYHYDIMKSMKQLEEIIISAVELKGYDGTVDNWDYDWTFPKSLMLTMTIISTIGYGHISPSTFWGQIFCIIYAVIGCPLFLIFLANVGEAMAHSFVYIYSRCCCRWCRSRRYISEIPKGASSKQRKLLIDDVVGEEEYMPTNKIVVPITVNLVVLSAYIVAGAVLFSYWENWAFHSSCYFTFVTLSTIGYGDMTPDSAMLINQQSFTATMKMLTCVMYIVAGMALLSMSINLMQEQLVEKFRWLAREVGLTKENKVEETPKPKTDSPKKISPAGNNLDEPPPPAVYQTPKVKKIPGFEPPPISRDGVPGALET